MELVDNETAAP